MGNTRKTGKEQYYTPLNTAQACLNQLDQIATADLYLEPCGGTGAFLKALGNRKWVSYDIEPKWSGVQRVDDFLTTDISALQDVITISNPPFGRANSLSIPFFNKCAEVSKIIAFIIPKSWEKWSIQNRLDRRFHLVSSVDLSVDYEYEDKPTSKGVLKTVFQIWEKRDYLRDLVLIPDYGYIKKTTPSEADLSLTVFGGGYGRVSYDFKRTERVTTQMYLKVQQPWVHEALQQINYAHFAEKVAYVQALSYPEINYLLHHFHLTNQAYENDQRTQAT